MIKVNNLSVFSQKYLQEKFGEGAVPFRDDVFAPAAFKECSTASLRPFNPNRA